MYPVKISLSAQQDLEEAVVWYDHQSQGLGDRLLEQVSKGVSSISANPYQFQIRYRSVRVHFTSIFPYGIHYIIEDKTVLILAIFHTSLSPRKWQRKV